MHSKEQAKQQEHETDKQLDLMAVQRTDEWLRKSIDDY